MNKEHPRTLVLSVNAFRRGGSNGRVLAKLFGNWPQDCIAQFYTYNELPDIPLCRNYFRVTDKEVLFSFIPWKKIGSRPELLTSTTSTEGALQAYKRKVARNPLTLLIQDIVWNLKFWQRRQFWQWIEDFNPEVIVLFATGSSYLNNLAVQISKKYRLPIVIFNTENYYFKNYNYFFDAGFDCFYPLYKYESSKAFERLMQHSFHEVYLNHQLERVHRERFQKAGTVLHQSSDLKPFEPIDTTSELRFTYAGNLGLNRHRALIEIADALQKISPSYYLDVYGRVTHEETEIELQQANGIRFHGLVPYSQVVDIMKASHFLVHAESFEERWVKDLCAAFTTKLSDILTVGRCLILYAHESISCAEYVTENRCGCVINRKKDLVDKLQELINDTKLQATYIQNGLKVSQRDMNFVQNSSRFKQILQKATGV